ncbi:nitrate- and nitrite sensing domain-containing protein [Actinoallomurus sp. CA-150999]|uniref:sensor histidine kinase n=1 Tax=Actinoallomurus sp. CA-150999 TaxID=3239887 RepID=UPI003D91CD71
MPNTRLRLKVTVLLTVVTCLWGFAAYVTARQGLDLLSVNTIDQKVGRPVVDLVTALQQERRLSAVYLGDPSPANRAALNAQRGRTDKTDATFRADAHTALHSRIRKEVKGRVRELLPLLRELPVERAAIDTKNVARAQATQTFDRIIDGAFLIYNHNAELDDRNISRDGRTLIALTRAKEVLSREDALVAGALASRRFTAQERLEFTELVGTERFLHAEAAAELPPVDRARYDQMVNGPAFVRFHTLEDRVNRPVTRARTQKLPVGAAEWAQAVEPVLTGVDKLVLTAGDELVERAKPGAYGVIFRLALAGGLGLVAVIAAIVMSITTTRRLMRQLHRLRNAARELADKRLPSVVERLGHGEAVDVEIEAPPLAFGSDEVGQVGRAFNSVQQTAIRTAVEQAELRRGFRDILLSLARRSQALLHRQLSLLDEMERRNDDAKVLEELFRIDHLATRMRRNAENLIILSGATPARGWRRPVPMIDVVRSAVAEVEDYARVKVESNTADVALEGRAVADTTHLLAELIENALQFSPPTTEVKVTGRSVAHGFAIEIEDHGLGMTDELIQETNERIRNPQEFNPSGALHLGHYVVGRLGARHQINVVLKPSAYLGTTAVVLIPRELITDAPAVAPGAETTGPAAAPAVVGAGSGVRPREIASAPVDERPVAITAASTSTITPDGKPTVQRISTRRRRQEHRAPQLARKEPQPVASGEEPRPSQGASHTPNGLPVRDPQASLVAALRTDGAPAPAEESEPETDRSPETVRRSLTGLQTATRRGRAEAARSRPAAGPEDGEASDSAKS